MRRYLALFLMLLLFLTGCTNNAIDPDATNETTEPVPTGYYEPNSQIEAQTGGSVRQYTLPDKSYRWIKNVGDRLLLATDEEIVQLRVLTGDECVPVAQLGVSEDAMDNCEALFNGFAYYDKQTHSYLFLDPQLQENQSVPLPNNVKDAVLSQNGEQIFYTVDNEIRSYDVSRKISRLIKTLSVENHHLVGSCFGGKIIICTTEDTAGKQDTLYISSENGQTLVTDNNILALSTYEERFLLERMDGTVYQRIVGTLNGEAKQLNIVDENVTGALELGGVVGYTATENELAINYYDFSTGMRTAALTLPGTIQVHTVLAEKWSGKIWILATDLNDNQMTLLCWNIKGSKVEDSQSYIDTLYTAQNPNTEALEALEERVSSLNKKYGVRIRLWQEAVKTPGNHTLVPEHQISAISDALDKLQAVLAEFPKNFISKSISSKVRICLVRSVDGEMKGVQYWSGKNAFIALSTGADIRSEFLKAFGYVIDSHVLGNSPKYDYWDTLNPSGFMYGSTVDESLVSGENRAFVNVESMASGTTDRSHIFWQSMQPENTEMFKSETMQAKLKMLCKAIRDAWGLERKTETYPWEQYLEKSIAYKKK